MRQTNPSSLPPERSADRDQAERRLVPHRRASAVSPPQPQAPRPQAHVIRVSSVVQRFDAIRFVLDGAVSLGRGSVGVGLWWRRW